MRFSNLTTPYFSKHYSFLKNAPNSKGWEHFFDFSKNKCYYIYIEMVKGSETS